jgi:hypothetical protein
MNCQYIAQLKFSWFLFFTEQWAAIQINGEIVPKAVRSTSMRLTGSVSQIASSLMLSSSPGIKALHILNNKKTHAKKYIHINVQSEYSTVTLQK